MSGYTPTTEQVRAVYAMRPSIDETTRRESQFDRWLEQVNAEALEEAADAWHAENLGTSPRAYKWFWDRAKQLRSQS